MENFSWIVFLLVPIYVVVHFVRNYFALRGRDFPGPCLAKFTNLWRLRAVYRGNFEHVLYDLHLKHGDVVRIGPRCLSISDPAAIEGIYGVKTDFKKSDYYNVMQAVENGKIIPTLVTTKEKNEHAALKRPIASAFNMSSMMKYEPFVDDTIVTLVKKLNEKFVVEDLPCEIHKWIQYFAFDVTGELTFSRPFGFLQQGKDVGGQIQSVVQAFIYFGVIGQVPIIDYYLTKHPIVLRLMKIKNPYIDAATAKLQERMEESEVIKDNNRQDLVSQFLEAKEKHPGKVTDQELIGYVMTMLIAGSDTSSVGLRAMVYFLAKYPDVQRRLQVELDSVGNLKYPVSWKETQNMPYLDAVIKESLRMHPGGAVIQERVVPETGYQLPDGRFVPAGTIVGIAGWNISRRKEIYGDDVDTFNPERWLRGATESEELYQIRLGGMKRADMTFSHGPRVCIGKNIALMEAYKLISTIFGLFEVRLENPDKEWTVTSATMMSQSDMDVRFEWRQGHSVTDLGR